MATHPESQGHYNRNRERRRDVRCALPAQRVDGRHQCPQQGSRVLLHSNGELGQKSVKEILRLFRRSRGGEDGEKGSKGCIRLG
jgi:hypothetical protein